MKLQDLFEMKSGDDISIKSVDDESVIELLNTHCSDAINLISTGKWIYKGWGDREFYSSSEVDPSRTRRRSHNTYNYYTMIFDHHPEMTAFPKRSQSLIASTSLSYSKIFALNYEAITVVIPFNGVKIGVVNKQDIWDTAINMLGTDFLSKSLKRFNDMFRDLKLSDSDWSVFKQQLKDPKLIKSFLNNFPDQRKYYHGEDLLDLIQEAYSPKHIGFTHCTTSNFKVSKDSEVWIGGPCLLIPLNDMKRVKSMLKDSK